jgi:hypothetical protein
MKHSKDYAKALKIVNYKVNKKENIIIKFSKNEVTAALYALDCYLTVKEITKLENDELLGESFKSFRNKLMNIE